MTQIIDRFFLERKRTVAHTDAIRNLAKRSGIKDEYEEVVGAVFCHQPAVFQYTRKQERDEEFVAAGSPLILRPKEIAAFFYNECFQVPPLIRGEDGVPLSIEEFCGEVVIRHAEDSERNQVSYLLGEVGVGKTALINYCITKYGEQWFEQGLWFVRLDLDPRLDQVRTKKFEFIDQLAIKTAKVLKRNPKISADVSDILKLADSLRLSCATQEGRTEKDMPEKQFIQQCQLLGDLITVIRQKTGRRLFLIIDNLDYICHIQDYGLFKSATDTENTNNLQELCGLAASFLHRGDLSHLGANILFVMRSETYKIVRQAAGISLPELESHMDDRRAFTIKGLSWRGVLDTRSELLKYVVSAIDKTGKRKEYNNLIKLLESHLLSGPAGQLSLIDHLEKITNYGLREMMDYFAQYAWLPASEGEVREEGIRRFINQYPVGLLTFILGKKRRFSQEYSMFPNIYLPPRRRTLREYGAFKYRHSYWLKRLIAHYIEAKEKDGEVVTPRKVVDSFSAKSPRGYQEPQIRACLGCLTDVRYSRMLQVHREKSRIDNRLRIADIKLTSRGQHLLSSIFDTFIYLQLILDDFMLPIPRVFKNEFRFPGDSRRVDYGYIMELGEDYHKGARGMIQLKAPRVLFFLEILDASLKLEQELNQGAFERLRSEGVTVPNVRGVGAGIVCELSRLSTAFDDFLDVERLQEAAEKNRDEIWKCLSQAYGGSE